MQQKNTLCSNSVQASIKALFLLFLFALPFISSAQLTVAVTETHVACAGDCTGSATGTVSGGTAPYTYIWNTGATTATATGLCGSVSGFPYDLTVTDATGASIVQWATIFSPSQLSVTAFGDVQICSLAPDGMATVVPSGGTPPYTYLWSNGGTTAQIVGLAQGTYTVTTTDANGCTAAASALVEFWNEGIWLMDSTVNLSCPNANDGFIHISAMSGTPPYSYNWNTGASGADLSGLSPGNYIVTVTDANGCSNQLSTVISQPTPISLTSSSVGASCGNTGSATINATGGAGTYTYLWSNGSTNSTISNQTAGSYSVTVTDANGCQMASTVVVVDNGGALAVSAVMASSATCNTGGTATTSASGGSGSYMYMWSNGQNGTNVSGLNAGTYTVTAVDSGTGCTGTASVTITQTTGPTVSVNLDADATCATGGTATASGAGTAGPYTYLWDNGQTTATATNLSAGSHTVSVTDAGGCVKTGSVNVSQVAGPTVSAVAVSPASCSGGGSATASATGGTAPYSYLWDNGETIATAVMLSSGPHSVTVTGADGCSATAMVTIMQANGPTAAAVAGAAATCTTGGSATATATGGSTPYTYLWDNGQTTATAMNLSVGSHSVTVTDGGGCSSVAMVTITGASMPTVTTTKVDETCQTPGSATATAAGGSSPYAYAWSNGATMATANGLVAGTYTVTITDAGGCTATATATIQAASAFSAMITSSSNATCDQMGTATATAFGGAGTITYAWDNGETTATAVNLAVGAHSVTVTDGSGCTATATLTIGLSNNGVNVGDRVWYNTSQSGFQDPIEVDGVNNVTVRLFKVGPDGIACTADDILIDTQVTDADGMYLFTCVTAGTYYVKFSGIPNGYQFSKKDNVNNDCKDSDADADGKTTTFTIVTGQADNLCIDAGIHQLCDPFTHAGFVASSQTICEGETPLPFYNVQFPSGGSGQIEYLWLQRVSTNTAGVWEAVPNGTSANLTVGPLYQTTQFQRCARRVGCNTFLESNVLTVTVLPLGSPGCGQFLKTINATVTQAKSVMVNWTVEPEFNAYNYYIQQSSNAIDWKDAGMVTGNQDNSGPVSYLFVDSKPSLGLNYYRIRRMDAFDVETISNAISIKVDFSRLETMRINPNPVQDVLNISNMVTYDTDVTLELISMSGAVIHTINLPANTFLDEKLPVQDLGAGVYGLRIRFADGETQTMKVMKY